MAVVIGHARPVPVAMRMRMQPINCRQPEEWRERQGRPAQTGDAVRESGEQRMDEQRNPGDQAGAGKGTCKLARGTSFQVRENGEECRKGEGPVEHGLEM